MSPTAATSATTKRPRGGRKVRVGQVISDKMQKTIVVRVTRRVRHPVYERVIKQFSAFKVHDETNSAKIGDWVKFMETRPLSKEKRWRLVEILRRASNAPPIPDVAFEQQPGGIPVSPASSSRETPSTAPTEERA